MNDHNCLLNKPLQQGNCTMSATGVSRMKKRLDCYLLIQKGRKLLLNWPEPLTPPPGRMASSTVISVRWTPAAVCWKKSLNWSGSMGSPRRGKLPVLSRSIRRGTLLTTETLDLFHYFQLFTSSFLVLLILGCLTWPHQWVGFHLSRRGFSQAFEESRNTPTFFRPYGMLPCG